MKSSWFILAMLLAGALPADTPPEDIDLDSAPVAELDVGEEPIELDRMTVTAEQFSLEQEAGIRLVRQALKQKRSRNREDHATWVCWFRKPTGSHLTHVECARNGDLNALSFHPSYPKYGRGEEPAYGKIWRTRRPVNRKKFMAMLEQFAGPDDFDHEFVALTLAGEHPPRDIPTSEELDRFADAYQAVNASSGTSEDELVALIEEQGLDLGRYNRIVDLIEQFQSLENEVAFRLGILVRPAD